jgi:hypothetical protein
LLLGLLFGFRIGWRNDLGKVSVERQFACDLFCLRLLWPLGGWRGDGHAGRRKPQLKQHDQCERRENKGEIPSFHLLSFLTR